MHSAALSSLLTLESLLEAADKVFSPELLHVPRFQRIHDMLNDVLQQVTTERLRLEFFRPESGESG